MDELQGLGILVAILVGVPVGAIVLFAVARELICWYWKINELITEVKRGNELQAEILAALRDREETSKPRDRKETSEHRDEEEDIETA